ncbi:anti-sigma regulatory factor (Ser/Thr protein kinase) [Nonomuraea fuscirosea]|uniref:Anti-sigma regulatory factor (Ser/Thr protein kinase) n=1 Tax=Nonomuraea fuscirosea TaxID=1291556 RepID=A0A2T0LKF6_9ACTN|nr:ATP-binding protein [Nonomuraea fuscirosea]PRX43378.1 anti-sigma regulatory factor (Ser/Thr protein kinase) [Nonomuraea fuscirosea]
METLPLLSMGFDGARLQATRHAVSGRARGQGLAGERLEDFLAAVNEGVVNAVQHGGGRGRLRMWRADGALLCEVRDTGPGIPDVVLDTESLPPCAAPGGRGIWLMRRLSDEVRFSTGPGGTVVRLSMRLPADAPPAAEPGADPLADPVSDPGADPVAETVVETAVETVAAASDGELRAGAGHERTGRSPRGHA